MTCEDLLEEESRIFCRKVLSLRFLKFLPYCTSTWKVKGLYPIFFKKINFGFLMFSDTLNYVEYPYLIYFCSLKFLMLLFFMLKKGTLWLYSLSDGNRNVICSLFLSLINGLRDSVERLRDLVERLLKIIP